MPGKTAARLSAPSSATRPGGHEKLDFLRAKKLREDAVMKQLGGIRACVFDAYGTLFDFTSAAARCRDRLGDRAGPLAALWRDKQIQYTWLRTLMGRHADFWQVTADGLDFALDTLGIRHVPGLKSDTIDKDGFPLGGDGLVIFNGELRVPVRRILTLAASYGWLDREQKDLSVSVVDAASKAAALDSAGK